jgi:hypothetical protein
MMKIIFKMRESTDYYDRTIWILINLDSIQDKFNNR